MTTTENEQISVERAAEGRPAQLGQVGSRRRGRQPQLPRRPSVVAEGRRRDQDGQGLHAAGARWPTPRATRCGRAAAAPCARWSSTRASTIAGKGADFPGGAHYADDYMTMLPPGLDAVRRPRPRLVRRRDLERLRRQDHDRRPGQGQRRCRSPRRASSGAASSSTSPGSAARTSSTSPRRSPTRTSWRAPRRRAPRSRRTTS